MRNDDKIIAVTPDVKWIGILDYDISTFDIVMTTEYGTTYNSYFIMLRKRHWLRSQKRNSAKPI